MLHAAPLSALAAFHDSLAAIIAIGLLLGIAGASFAVGVPFVSRWFAPERQGWALGIYGMGMGGTVLGALTAPAISDAWGLTAPFIVAAVLLAAVAIGLAVLARDATPPAGGRIELLAPLRVFRTSSRMSRCSR